MNNTDCGYIRELLPAYITGQLDTDRRMEVASHLAHCAECRVEAGTVLQIAKACAVAFPDPDGDFMDSAFKLLDSGAEPEKPRSALETLTGAVAAARCTLTITRKVLAFAKIF